MKSDFIPNGAHVYFGRAKAFVDYSFDSTPSELALVGCDFDHLEQVFLSHKPRVTSQYVWVDEWSDYGYKFPIKGEAKFLETYPIKIAAVDAWHAKNGTPPFARDWQQMPSIIVLDSLSAISERWHSAYL